MYGHPLLALQIAHDVMRDRERLARGHLYAHLQASAPAPRWSRLRGIGSGLALAVLGLPRPSAATGGC